MGLDLDLSSAQTNEPVPAGTYNVVVEKAEVSTTKAGGEMIKIQLKIVDGPSAGRVIFDQFNIKNANPQAVQIGLGQLKGLMKAFGHANPNRLESTVELQGLKGQAVTKVEEDNGFGAQARVKAYKASVGAAPATAAAAAAPANGANPFA